MKKLLALLLVPLGLWAADPVAVTNQFLTVDQNGKLNAEGVATVEDVATNAVAVQIANARAATAAQTAKDVTNALEAVVQNIMENNVVIYRSGFTDSFAALVVYTDSDKLVICDYSVDSVSSSAIVSTIKYCCTANLGTTKPTVMAHNTCTARTDFEQVDAANVTTPTYTVASTTVGDDTFAGYYTITVTIPNPSSTTSYVYWIKLDADTPSGDGSTLDLNNGVTGGVTGSYSFGSNTLRFKGGVLVEVQ